MRLAPQPPAQLSSESKAFHDQMVGVISEHLKGFVSKRSDDALIGPFNPMLRFPQFGKATWEVLVALIKSSTLPRSAHEVAVLVTGAAFSSRYEVYAREHVAEGVLLCPTKISVIAAGQRPSDLDAAEAAAYDLAAVLSGGKQLPESTYRAALTSFGDAGVAELVYLVGYYCLLSVVLNAYHISVPGREEGLG